MDEMTCIWVATDLIHIKHQDVIIPALECDYAGEYQAGSLALITQLDKDAAFWLDRDASSGSAWQYSVSRRSLEPKYHRYRECAISKRMVSCASVQILY